MTSPIRRILHIAFRGKQGATLDTSTLSAEVTPYVPASEPPYPMISVSGTYGVSASVDVYVDAPSARRLASALNLRAEEIEAAEAEAHP